MKEKQKSSEAPADINEYDSYICRDFDNDCKLVSSPVKCFMGGLILTKNGKWVYTDIANGYCPLCNCSN
jgi:hypothetical protein